MQQKMNLEQPLERVMLVDDDLFMLSYLSDMLTEIGVKQVLSLHDARTALLALPDNLPNLPNLLICDLSMPDMDGIEFLDKVARLGYSGSVLLHSGVDAGVIRAAERLAKAHGLNVIGSFVKPISKASLVQSLSSISKQRND